MPPVARTRNGITLAPAVAADARRAEEITREAFNGVSVDQALEQALGKANDLSWQDIKGQEVRREFLTTPQQAGTGPSACFVARAGAELVGYVTCQVDLQTSRGRICNLAVDKACRGKGVGRMLIEYALDYFRALGLAQAKIETLATNPVGQHLYPSCGFVEVARQVHYALKL